MWSATDWMNEWMNEWLPQTLFRFLWFVNKTTLTELCTKPFHSLDWKLSDYLIWVLWLFDPLKHALTKFKAASFKTFCTFSAVWTYGSSAEPSTHLVSLKCAEVPFITGFMDSLLLHLKTEKHLALICCWSVCVQHHKALAGLCHLRISLRILTPRSWPQGRDSSTISMSFYLQEWAKNSP